MNLYFLKYFTDTYKLQSISLAAKANNVSNTAVSKGIKSLESSLNLGLIHHKKNQLIFTKEAERIYSKSLDVLSRVSDLSDDLSPVVTTKKIGIIHSLATGRLSQVISDMSELMDIQVLIGNPTEIKSLLSRYIIDMGITLKRESSLGANEIMLHKGQFSLFESTISKAKKEIIYMTPDWPEVSAFRKESKLLLDSKYKVCIIDSWDAIYSAVKKGKGYGLLPDYFKIDNKKIKKAKVSNFKRSYNVILKHQNNFYDEEIFSAMKKRF